MCLCDREEESRRRAGEGRRRHGQANFLDKKQGGRWMWFVLGNLTAGGMFCEVTPREWLMEGVGYGACTERGM